MVWFPPHVWVCFTTAQFCFTSWDWRNTGGCFHQDAVREYLNLPPLTDPNERLASHAGNGNVFHERYNWQRHIRQEVAKKWPKDKKGFIQIIRKCEAPPDQTSTRSNHKTRRMYLKVLAVCLIRCWTAHQPQMYGARLRNISSRLYVHAIKMLQWRICVIECRTAYGMGNCSSVEHSGVWQKCRAHISWAWWLFRPNDGLVRDASSQLVSGIVGFGWVPHKTWPNWTVGCG